MQRDINKLKQREEELLRQLKATKEGKVKRKRERTRERKRDREL